MDALRHLDPDTQTIRFGEYLQTLESHIEAASNFSEEVGEDPELAELLELMEECREEFLALRESVSSGTDDEVSWDSMTENWSYLSRALARFGGRNWQASGPTDSWRINQFFLLCGQSPIQTSQLQASIFELKKVADVLKNERGESLEPLVEALKTAQSEFQMDRADLGPWLNELLYPILESLASEMDLREFDRQFESTQTWLQQFRSLTEAVSLGEVDAQYLLQERDLAVKRLEPLLETSVDKSVAVEDMPDILIDARAHLLQLEKKLQDPDCLEDWFLDLQELWDEIKELDEQSKHGPGVACTVCGTEIPKGEARCPSCNTLRFEEQS